jgi:hypothetical protein
VYFPQFCDINNLVEKIVKFTLGKKNSQNFLNFLSPKKKKKKTTKKLSPKKITGFTTLAISQNCKKILWLNSESKRAKVAQLSHSFSLSVSLSLSLSLYRD